MLNDWKLIKEKRQLFPQFERHKTKYPENDNEYKFAERIITDICVKSDIIQNFMLTLFRIEITVDNRVIAAEQFADVKLYLYENRLLMERMINGKKESEIKDAIYHKLHINDIDCIVEVHYI